MDSLVQLGMVKIHIIVVAVTSRNIQIVQSFITIVNLKKHEFIHEIHGTGDQTTEIKLV